MTNINITYSTDTNKIRQTGVAHGADALKTNVAPLAHTTDLLLQINGVLSHGTSLVKFPNARLSHGTDTHKVLAKTGANYGLGGDILGQTTDPTPKLFKNDNNYLSIGSGLSVMVGLPRIATWNTAGRPKRPATGTIGFNTETKSLEFWNGKQWFVTPLGQN